MLFYKMESFRHYTSNKEGAVTFTFYKVFTLEGRQFLVIASDFNSKFQMFHMQWEDEQWKFMDPEKLPGWVSGFENELHQVIEKNTAVA